MTSHPDEQARELFYELKPECQAHADGCKGCAEAIASVAALLARIRQQALEEACKALCEHCRIAEPRTIESDEKGTYYWHDFGNLSAECQASKVRAAAAQPGDTAAGGGQ